MKDRAIVWYKRGRMGKYLHFAKRLENMRMKELFFRFGEMVRRSPLRELLHLSRFTSKARAEGEFDLTLLEVNKIGGELLNGKRRLFYDWSFGSTSKEILSGGRSKDGMSKEPGEAVIAEAEDILNHRFTLFGRKYEYGCRINWHLDPLTNKEWPLVSGRRFERDYNVGDIKYVWELNRHKHFVTLGKAYVLTREKKWTEGFVRQINSWIEDNPVGFGVNWASNLEVGMRTVSWIWAYNLLLDSPDFDDCTHSRMIQSIREHGCYLSSNLSIYSDPTNHLIGEATALWMIGVVFPEFRESDRWKKVGFDILVRELDKQVHEDGVNAEQSISYHRFVLDFYSQVVVLARKNHISLPVDMVQKVERMFEYIMEVVDENGRAPMIGDADDARGMPVAEGDFWDFRDSLCTGAVLFERGDMKSMAREYQEASFWFLGIPGKEKFDTLPHLERRLSSRSFNRGGYYIMQSEGPLGQMKMIFDCGPLGYLPNAGHGHADMLSFTLNICGRDMIVDPGTFGYAYAEEKRDYFRGTRAHNTIWVDELDQADPCGIFKWLNIPTARINGWITTEEYDFVDGSHNGYARLKWPMTHRRMVIFVKREYWVIVDLLCGLGNHKCELSFHFPPCTAEVDATAKMAIVRRDGNANLIVAPAEPQEVLAEVFKGCTQPFEGWISPNYGNIVPAPVLRYARQSDLPVVFGTLLLPFGREEPSSFSIKRIGMHRLKTLREKIGFCVEINGKRDVFIMPGQEMGTKEKKWCKPKREVSYVRRGKSKNRERIFIINDEYVSQEYQDLTEGTDWASYL